MAILQRGDCVVLSPSSSALDPFWSSGSSTGFKFFPQGIGSGSTFGSWAGNLSVTVGAVGSALEITGTTVTPFASFPALNIPSLQVCLGANFTAYGISTGAEQLQGYKNVIVQAQFRDLHMTSGICYAAEYGPHP